MKENARREHYERDYEIMCMRSYAANAIFLIPELILNQLKMSNIFFQFI